MAIERTAEAYQRAFDLECANEYPVIDAFEERMGFAVDRMRLEAAAQVLACPLKKNPPSWQHGRVIYALARSYLARNGGKQYWLDIGSAKGFSAVCMSWAYDDASCEGRVLSLDIISPDSREPRNSIDDGKTIAEFTREFIPIGSDVMFLQGAASEILEPGEAPDRINFAFIDGSHTYDGVKADIATVTPRQLAGDIIMFDDLQVAGIVQAVSELDGYNMEYIDLLPKRKYAIAVRR